MQQAAFTNKMRQLLLNVASLKLTALPIDIWQLGSTIAWVVDISCQMGSEVKCSICALQHSFLLAAVDAGVHACISAEDYS